ncbi:MAG: hypothetical protein AB8B64_22485 [Granulosicoccus sp.]
MHIKIHEILAGSALLLVCQLLLVEQATGNDAATATSYKEPAIDGADDVSRILAFFPVDKRQDTPTSCLAASADTQFLTREFALEGRCKQLDQTSGRCAYQDYRKLDLSAITGFDQRGVYSYQVTFPGDEHLWAALSVNNKPGSRFCWVGGAHVGQNPLTMTWGGETGTKRRKNNFILSESGQIHVEAARIHNLHDLFLASDANAGFSINSSWITWNRDDVFEGYLHELSFRNTLVDGTYTFISDPDGDCDAAKKAADRTIVIENSLIRLQRQPGPFARHTGKWDWAIEGGHNTLWKLDSCDWEEWPAFVLKNNVFLIEGPRTTFKNLNTTDCRLALPGDCADPALRNLKECHNNLFLYTDYFHWRKAGKEPGPAPQPGNRFHNARNPAYLPNGLDCYQRLTDDQQGAESVDVVAIWKALRRQWIDWHTDADSVDVPVMSIPGVDKPVFRSGTTIRLINRQSGQCLSAKNRHSIQMQDCRDSSQQFFTVSAFGDGKLEAALLLSNDDAGYLRSEPTSSLKSTTDRRRSVVVFGNGPSEGKPMFEERWYIAPLPDTPDTQGYFYIETDALQRTFLRQEGKSVGFQALFAGGIRTALPQGRFRSGNDHHLQWKIQIVGKS